MACLTWSRYSVLLRRFLLAVWNIDYARDGRLHSTGRGAAKDETGAIIVSALAGPLEELFFLGMIIGGTVYAATKLSPTARYTIKAADNLQSSRTLVIALTGAVLLSAALRSCVHVYQGPIGWVPAIIWGGAAAAYFAYADRSWPTLIGIATGHTLTNLTMGLLIGIATDTRPIRLATGLTLISLGMLINTTQRLRTRTSHTTRTQP